MSLKTELPFFTGATTDENGMAVDPKTGEKRSVVSYASFVWRVEQLIKVKGLRPIFEQLNAGVEPQGNQEQRNAWDELTGHVISKLIGDAEEVVRVAQAEELHTVLLALKNAYSCRAKSSRHTAFQSLATGGRKKGETIDQLVARKKTIMQNDLNNEVTPDELVLFGVVQALSPGSKAVAAPCMAHDMNLQQLTNTLREHDGMKGKEKEKDEHALKIATLSPGELAKSPTVKKMIEDAAAFAAEKAVKGKGKGWKQGGKPTGGKPDHSQVTCHKCKKKGHIAVNCPTKTVRK
eukprot:g19034.t1